MSTKQRRFWFKLYLNHPVINQQSSLTNVWILDDWKKWMMLCCFYKQQIAETHTLNCHCHPWVFNIACWPLSLLALPILRLLSSVALWCKDFWTLSFWYSLESSCRVLSIEYLCARVSVIFHFFASFCIGQISHQQYKQTCPLYPCISP